MIFREIKGNKRFNELNIEVLDIKVSEEELNVLKQTSLTNVGIMERIIMNGHHGQIWQKSMEMILKS